MSRGKLAPLGLALGILVAVSAGCAQSQSYEALTEENVKKLLTIGDVEGVLESEARLTTRFYYYKKTADPQQVAAMDSFYGLSFQTEDGMKGITLAAMDFGSPASAKSHFEKVQSEAQLNVMGAPLGDASAKAEHNTGGIGSMVVFVKGDKVISLHTAQPDGETPLASLAGLEKLAEMVDKRL